MSSSSWPVMTPPPPRPTRPRAASTPVRSRYKARRQRLSISALCTGHPSFHASHSQKPIGVIVPRGAPWRRRQKGPTSLCLCIAHAHAHAHTLPPPCPPPLYSPTINTRAAPTGRLRLQDMAHAAPRNCTRGDVSLALPCPRVDRASAMIRVDDILGDGLAHPSPC